MTGDLHPLFHTSHDESPRTIIAAGRGCLCWTSLCFAEEAQPVSLLKRLTRYMTHEIGQNQICRLSRALCSTSVAFLHVCSIVDAAARARGEEARIAPVAAGSRGPSCVVRREAKGVGEGAAGGERAD